MLNAVKSNIKVMACVGEKLEHREANQTLQVVFAQLKAIADKLSPELWARVVSNFYLIIHVYSPFHYFLFHF